MHILRIKVALIAFAPVAAWAGEQVLRRAGSAESVTPWTWFFILAFALLGWMVADLDKVAELWNLEGKSPVERVRARLVFVKNVATALLAGVIAFFFGRLFPGLVLGLMGVQTSAPEIPEMALLLATAFAGYMGARFFAWLELKLTGK